VTHRILIAGGGIGGMAAALALIDRGHDVEVFEQAPELKEFGAGVQISPNGTRALHALGVLDALRELSCDTAGKEVRLWNTGRTWKLFDLGTEAIERYGFPYITVFRPDLLQVLLDAVRAKRPDAIHLGRRVAGVTQSEAGVTLRLEDGASVAGDALIAAEGVHSVIRHQLFGGDRARFFGMIAWRGVIPIERVPAQISRDKATNWIGVGGHVVHYPLRAGRLMNFVGIQERSDWQVESWTTQGTAAECANDHKGWHADVHALIAAAPSLYKWALISRDPLPQWTVGRVTLLGDACHPTLPMLAQGAVMAIEDAVILGRCFDKYGDVLTALARYQDARMAVTTRKVNGANDNGKRFHNPALGTEAGATAYVDREWSRDAIIRRYEWIFTYDVEAAEI
jgi:2-polyprenyl-6-methoxyphenol hydroxylase-like FAD-dependent oxidoreductase